MSGTGKVIAAVVLGPIAILVTGIGGCEARKAYYDWQVRQMCAKSGGVTIYERVRITAEQASRLGTVAGHFGVPSESSANADVPAFSRLQSVTLHCCDPTLMRHDEEIVRRQDGRVVARTVRFSRSGGDFPFTASHPSSFGCPENLPQFYEQRSKVFQVEGMNK
jgi:hypothetical protein